MMSNGAMDVVYFVLGSAFLGSFITLVYRKLQNGNNHGLSIVYERLARLEERTQKIEEELKELKDILFRMCNQAHG